MTDRAPRIPTPLLAGLAVGLLLVHLALVLHGATRHSAVFDEVVYPTSGYAYLTTGDYRFNPEHPPFLKLWLALPWLAERYDVTAASGWDNGDQWAFGRAMIYGEGRDHASLLLRARAMNGALSTVLGFSLFLVARRLAGDPGGLVGLALYTFDPLVVAHAGFATLDVGATCFYFLAAICFVPALFRGGAWRVSGTGVILGLALASKFSNVLLLPVLAAVVAWGAWNARKREQGGSPVSGGAVSVAGRALLIVGVALVVVSLCYGPAGPALYLRGLNMLVFHGAVGHPAYAFGQYGASGWWWYFPAAWAVKTPIPLLIASTAGVLFLLKRLRTEPSRIGVLVLAPALVLAASIASPLNIGVRHLLQITPFLALAGGCAAAALWTRGRAPRAVTLLLLAWLALGTLRVHPNQIAYANEASGGPRNLWRKLADSNVDWGQDLPALAREVGRHPLRRLYLGYMGTAEPRAYGLDYCWIPSTRMIDRRYQDGPDPEGREWIAISVTNLLNVYGQRPDLYAWLQDRPFTAFPGYSIALFDITGEARTHQRIGEIALELGDPVTALPPLRRAVEIEPGHGPARLALAAALFAGGYLTEALEECEEAERLLDSVEASQLCERIRGARRSPGAGPLPSALPGGFGQRPDRGASLGQSLPGRGGRGSGRLEGKKPLEVL
jgi:hypothetical protein